MNKRDIKRLDAILTLADTLMNAGETGSGVTNAEVVEAILGDLSRATRGLDACWLVALVERDERVAAYAAVPLDSMSFKELREYARSIGASSITRLARRDELIRALKHYPGHLHSERKN